MISSTRIVHFCRLCFLSLLSWIIIVSTLLYVSFAAISFIPDSFIGLLSIGSFVIVSKCIYQFLVVQYILWNGTISLFYILMDCTFLLLFLSSEEKYIKLLHQPPFIFLITLSLSYSLCWNCISLCIIESSSSDNDTTQQRRNTERRNTERRNTERLNSERLNTKHTTILEQCNSLCSTSFSESSSISSSISSLSSLSKIEGEIQDQNQCIICLQVFILNDITESNIINTKVHTNCNNEFHFDCIKQWIYKTNKTQDKLEWIRKEPSQIHITYNIPIPFPICRTLL